MAGNWVKSACGKIACRDWGDLRDYWGQSLLDVDPPGSAPEHTVAELVGVEQELEECQETVPRFVDSIPGVRDCILHEGIFLLHKAVNVLGAAERHADAGIESWALSSGYHASLFAAQAIVRFLGVSLADTGCRTLIVDTFPEKETLSSKARKRGEVAAERTMLLIRPTTVGHRDTWRFFQRTLNISKVGEHVVTKDVQSHLKHTRVEEFAKQRNRIHYGVNHWPGNDLHTCITTTGFGYVGTGSPLVSSSEGGFSLANGAITVSVAAKMLASIVSVCPTIQGELDLLQDCAKPPIFPRYHGVL